MKKRTKHLSILFLVCLTTALQLQLMWLCGWPRRDVYIAGRTSVVREHISKPSDKSRQKIPGDRTSEDRSVAAATVAKLADVNQQPFSAIGFTVGGSRWDTDAASSISQWQNTELRTTSASVWRCVVSSSSPSRNLFSDRRTTFNYGRPSFDHGNRSAFDR